MKIRHLMLVMTTAVAASSLPSCTHDDFRIEANEEYTRNFIETFGLIDPAQDWNLAKSTDVTVKVGDTSSHVKAYMKVDGTYYLVADIKEVSGTLNIPFDMPEGTREIMVKINGERYYTSPGGTVDPSAPGSRTTSGSGPAGSIDETTGLGVSGIYGGRRITISKTEGDKYLTIKDEDVHVAQYSLLDHSQGLAEYYPSDRMNEDFTYNFSAYVKEFYLFPEYYSCSDTPIIGIYWDASPITEGAENVKITDPYGKEISKWIVRVPILQHPQALVTMECPVYIQYHEFHEISNWEDIFLALKEKYPDKYFWGEEIRNEYFDLLESEGQSENNPFYLFFDLGMKPDLGGKFRLFSDGKYREINDTADDDGYCGDLNHEICYDIISIYPEFFLYGGALGQMDGYKEIPARQSMDYYEDLLIYKSRGIHVVLNDFHTIGFYCQVRDKIMYSQIRLNEWRKVWNYNKEIDEYQQTPYMVTYIEGQDEQNHTKRYIGFDDWHGSNNPMLFRIYSLDNSGNGYNQSGYVINEETTTDPYDPTDPYNPTDPDTPEVEEPYHWLLAVEDLGATDDFDFNDIIMGISAELTTETPEEGARTVGDPMSDSSTKVYNKVTFSALAAGGTRKAYVYYDDQLLYPDGEEGRAEWHAWFGDGSLSSTTMINTNANGGVDNAEGATCTIYFGLEEGSAGKFRFSVEKLGMKDKESTDARDSGFRIGIDASDNISSANISPDYFAKGEDGYFVKPAGAGKAPQMFLIPDRWNKEGGNSGTSSYDTISWQWPKERQHIQVSYSRFADWVSDPEGAADWYKDEGTATCRPTN